MQTSTSFSWERSKTSVEELQLAESVEGQSGLIDLLSCFIQGFKHQWAETSSFLGKPWKETQSAFSIGTSILAEIEGLFSWLIAKQVRLSKPDQIREYLLQFPDLMDIIPLALRAAQSRFPEAQPALSVYHDPEVEDHYLALYVRLKQYDESVMERIEAAEAEFIDRLADKEGWLQLTTDFREPEAEDAL